MEEIIQNSETNASKTDALENDVLIIHHLSDLHVGKLHYYPSDELDIPEIKFQSNKLFYNIDKYLDYLKRLQAQNLPDLVIISGDLTSFASETEFTIVKRKIREIKSELSKKRVTCRNIQAPYILMVPGNHDIEWIEGTYETRIKRYAEMATDLYGNGEVLSAVYSEDSNNAISYDFGEDWNLFVYLFDSASLSGLKDNRFAKMNSALMQKYQPLLTENNCADKYQSLKEFEKDFVLSPGYISEDALENIKNNKVPTKRFKIAVMHHNLSSAPSNNIERFDAIVNAGFIKQHLQANGFDLVLHGHSHNTYCHYERFLQQDTKNMCILGGDSLGVKEDAPFLEIKIIGSKRAHSDEIPACRVIARSFTNKITGYTEEPKPIIDDIIDDQINSTFREVLKKIEDGDPKKLDYDERKNLLKRIRTILDPMIKLEYNLADLGDESPYWNIGFHFRLDRYSRIYATDFHSRLSLDVPRFNQYLRKQYERRSKDLSVKEDRILYFSKHVHDAIKRTKWTPNPYMWKGYKVKPATSYFKELEIVRILIRSKKDLNDSTKLKNLDYDHRCHAIPLFVLDKEELDSDELVNFAIGFDNEEKVLSCYVFDEYEGRAIEIDPRDSLDKVDIFKNMLQNTSLKTVQQFLNEYD